MTKPVKPTVCAIHKSHSPRPLSTEAHHILPRAWQAIWSPPDDKRLLWAPKTIDLCPTGHSNVHRIIVDLMHDFEAHGVKSGPDVQGLIDEYRRTYAAGRMNELPIAAQAPLQWLQRGGTLDVLWANKQYGYGLSTRIVPTRDVEAP